jgi:hypothetical protein
MVVGELVEALVLEVTLEFERFHLSWCSPVRRHAREKSRRNTSGVFGTYGSERHGRNRSLDRVDGPRLDRPPPFANSKRATTTRRRFARRRGHSRVLSLLRAPSLSRCRALSLSSLHLSLSSSRALYLLALSRCRALYLSLACA